MMNSFKKTSLLVAGFALLSTPALAQKKQIRNAGASLSFDGVEYTMEAKNSIDQAYINPLTNNDPQMWLYRAITYARCYNSKNHPLFNGVDLSTSGLAAGTSMVNFYNAPEKKSSDMDYATENLPAVFGAVFNEAIPLQKRKSYDSIVTYFEIAKNLYDRLDTATVRSLANNNLTRSYIDESYFTFVYLMKDETKKEEILNKAYNSGDKRPLIVEALYKMRLAKGDTSGAETIIMNSFNENKNYEYFVLVQNFYIAIDKAEKLFVIVDDLIKNDGSNTAYYYIRGKLHDEINNNHNAALEDYKKAVELDEFNYDAYFDMAVNLINNHTMELRTKKVTARNPEDIKKADEGLKAVYKEAEKYLLIANENIDFSLNDKININKALRTVYQELGDAAKALYYKNMVESLEASR